MGVSGVAGDAGVVDPLEAVTAADSKLFPPALLLLLLPSALRFVAALLLLLLVVASGRMSRARSVSMVS